MKNSQITRLIALLGMVFLFGYCKKPTEFKEIEVDSLFTLQVPVYFHSTRDIMPEDAPRNVHQYRDSVGEICMLIFDSTREDIGIPDLKTFYDSMVAQTNMDSVRIVSKSLIKIDNDSAFRAEITGIQNGQRIFTEIECIATKDRYYHIATWASLRRREEVSPDMIKMLNSFHDISHKKI